jgi:hypothetical protein
MDSVDVTIPVDMVTAAALESDPVRRAAAGRLMTLLVHPSAGADPLLATMRQMGEEAAALGLTPEMIAAELAAHKAGR